MRLPARPARPLPVALLRRAGRRPAPGPPRSGELADGDGALLADEDGALLIEGDPPEGEPEPEE